MDDREQKRKIRHRLAVLRHAEEVSGNVAATCRYYGISRSVFYRWKNRFDEQGPEGLRDRSSRPHNSPTATKGEVVERIVHLRQNCHFGPARIAMYLNRYHDVEISSSGVWRVGHRLGLGRLPANQRYKRRTQRPKRYEKQRPGHRVQIDVKFIAPIDGVTTKRHCQFTAIDDCTRLRVLRIYPKADQRTAIGFLDYVTERLPFPVEVIQTDNGAESPDRLRLARARPRHRPRLHQARHSQAQRQPRTLAPHRRRGVLCRLLDGVTIDDTDMFNDRLRAWEGYYNFERPHGGLDGQTPYGRLKQKTSQP